MNDVFCRPKGYVDLYGLILSMLGNCCHLLVFFIVSFYQNTLGFIVRVSNGLDHDRTQYFLGPDLCPNCLQIIPAQHIYVVASRQKSPKVISAPISV